MASTVVRLPFRAALAALLVVVASCSGGGDGATDPTPDQPVTVTLSLGSTTVEVTQGDNAATMQISINRPSGFTGTVNLAASAPTGITATLTPPALTGTATMSTLSVAAGSGVAAGDYAVTVTATGNNVATSSVVLPLSVKAPVTPPPPPAGTFTIAASPTAVSVQAGNAGTSTVTITRVNSFAGTVALTATGAPAGVTPSFAPASVVATTSTLTLTTTGVVVPGVYPITVRANATGIAEQTAVVTLTVTAAPGGGGGGGGNVSWSFCGSLAPLWFAVQDGTGAWTRITATTPGVYQFNITQARGGVAYVQQEGTRFVQKMFFQTQAELIETGASLCPSGTAKTNNGSVANAGTTTYVTLGGRQVSVVPGTSTNFSITNVADGGRDLIAARTSLNIGTFSLDFDRAIIRRNVNVANNGTIPVLDFAAGESFAPVARTLTLTNTNGNFVNVVTQFTTANGAVGGAGLLQTTTPAVASSVTWLGVPADRQIAGDRHTVVVSGIASTTFPASLNGRSLLFFTAAPQDANIAFGPLLTGATESALGTAPYVRRRVQYTPQSDYNRYFVAQWQHDASGGRTTEMNMSSGYTSGGAVDLSMPDFSAVAGFNNDWGLKVGALTTWTFSAVGWTGGGISGPTADGSVAKSAQAGAQITP